MGRAGRARVKALREDPRATVVGGLGGDPAAVELPVFTELPALLDAVDAVATRFGGDRFYADRIPHFSIAWSLGPFSAQIASPARDRASRVLGGHALTCDRVECRVGERVTEFKLRVCQEVP